MSNYYTYYDMNYARDIEEYIRVKLNSNKQVLKIFNKFLEKLRNSKFESFNIFLKMEDILHIVYYITMDKRLAKTKDQDFIYFLENIFTEISSLYRQSLKKPDNTQLSEKISCISRVMFLNNIGERGFVNKVKDTKLFHSYFGIYNVIKIINKRYADIMNIGVAIEVIDSYWKACLTGEIKSDFEKIRDFEGILDGNLKFKPIYTQTGLCFSSSNDDGIK